MAEPRTQNRSNPPSKTERPRIRAAETPRENPEPTKSDDDSSVAVISMLALDRDLMIAEAAYYRAQRRDFEPGHELEDWLAAESEIDTLLLKNPSRERPA